MRLIPAILCAAVASVAARPASPSGTGQASASDARLVSAAWLSAHAHDADLVILQVGAGFANGHVPGAREAIAGAYIASGAAGLDTELPPVDRLREGLASLGISDRSHVVVAYTPSRAVASATRLVFTLDYAGLGARTSLLDGGLDAWKRAGYPVSTGTEAPSSAAPLSPLATAPIVVDGDFVRTHLHTPGLAIVDARTDPFYTGAQAGGSAAAPQRPGHIPGALSVPYTSLTNDDGTLRAHDELAAIFTRAGVKPGDTVVGYCHIGIQATAVLFAARLLGHPVRLYDGSFQDWSRHPDWPVEK